MLDWTKYKAEEVKTGTDKNGNRLISAFARDYKNTFNQDLCPSCKDFKEKFLRLIKEIKRMKNTDTKKSGYLLKKMYENIPLKFGSSIYVNNSNITDEYALELINNHPRGSELFEMTPKKEEKKTSKKQKEETSKKEENTK